MTGWYPRNPWSSVSEAIKPLPMTTRWTVLSSGTWQVGWKESEEESPGPCPGQYDGNLSWYLKVLLNVRSHRKDRSCLICSAFPCFIFNYRSSFHPTPIHRMDTHIPSSGALKDYLQFPLRSLCSYSFLSLLPHLLANTGTPFKSYLKHCTLL